MFEVNETVFLGYDNEAAIYINQDGSPVDLSAVTRFACRIGATIADSSIEPTLFDWSEGNGKLTINFGSLSIAPGAYSAILIAYDPLHPNGQVIAHPASNSKLNIHFA